MKKILLLILLPFSVLSQPVQMMNSAEILAGIKKLNVLGSVLYIAAHPDDENTRLITYLNKERNIRTAYLSLTRGDGGQNLVGKEQAEALGLVRTQELLAARRIDGGEQFFTRANDFGFSKNPDETFRFWNKDSVLSDVVWVIRNFKPDVIICRFPTTGEGGHGHHTASAILASIAFEAAADPKKFPEQLKYTTTWQAKKLFWNTFNFGGTNTTSPDQLKIDVGIYNSLIGKGYGEIAAESRSMHKSQGFGSAKARGSVIEYFKQLKGDSTKKDIVEGIDMTWNKINGGGAIQKMINDCIQHYDPQQPDKSIMPLLSIYLVIKALPENDAATVYWKNRKMSELENLLLNCAGVWLEASATNYSAIPGTKIEYTLQCVKGTDADVLLKNITWASGTDSLAGITLKKNDLVSMKHSEILSEKTPYSNPYWLNREHAEGLYSVSDRSLIGRPENPPTVTVTAEFLIQEVPFKIIRPVVYKSADPVKGEVYRPFEVLPAVNVNFPARAFALHNGGNEKIQVEIKSNIDSSKGKIKIIVPGGWSASPDTISYSLNRNENKYVDVLLTAPSKSSSGTIAAISVNGDSLKSIRRIEYDHIPYQFILSDSKASVVSFDLSNGDAPSGSRAGDAPSGRMGTKNIGYIPGAGDDVASSLKQIGFHVSILTEELLSKEDLSQFDAIITGIRAYNTNEWMQNEYSRLMDYVKQGGNLIVQYNTNNRIGPVVAKISPFPFTISRERVTDETAEVRFVNPSHPVLNFPNKITADDFKGWKQERGIYFASDLDSSYQTVLSMNDPGEKPNEGSLIICKYGKGNFVYTGLVFFRELPAGVPGAYRLFSNMISLPKNE